MAAKKLRMKGQAILSAVCFLSAFAGSAYSEGDELQANRHRWQAAGIHRYAYHYERPCACQQDSQALFAISVVGNVVTGVVYLQPESGARTPIAQDRRHWYPTVDDLFDRLAEAAATNAARVEATYDPRYGYPMRIYIDYDPTLPDDEVDIRISGFEIRD